MAKAYGYIRVSHIDSFNKGSSMEAQKLRVTGYYEKELQSQGIEWGGVHDDGTNVSAYKTPFHLRPAGKILVEKLKKGDHLIVDKVDRFWRSLNDFVGMMSAFKKRGITVHIVSFMGQAVTNTTPMGGFILKIFVILAELESQMKAERSAEVWERERAQALSSGRTIQPLGTTFQTTMINGKERLERHWSKFRRSVMSEQIRLNEEEGLPLGWQCDKIKQFAAEKLVQLQQEDCNYDPTEDREWINRFIGWFNNKSGPQRLRNHYYAELSYRYLGLGQIFRMPRAKYLQLARKQVIELRHRRRIEGYKPKFEIVSPEAILKEAGVWNNGYTQEQLEAGAMVGSTQYWDVERQDYGYLPKGLGEYAELEGVDDSLKQLIETYVDTKKTL